MQVKKLITAPIKSALRHMGYQIIPYVPPSLFPRDYDQQMIEEILDAKKYTMTPV
jgi:hypothetical protein